MNRLPVMMVLAACASFLPACETAGRNATADASMDLHNTKCVVTGEDVGNSKLFAVYQGKMYHFCCDGCPQEFQKDPAKFAKAVAADPAKYGVKAGG